MGNLIIIEGNLVANMAFRNTCIEEAHSDGYFSDEDMMNMNIFVSNRFAYAFKMLREKNFVVKANNSFGFEMKPYISQLYQFIKLGVINCPKKENCLKYKELNLDIQLSDNEFVKTVYNIGFYGIDRILKVFHERELDIAFVEKFLKEYFNMVVSYLFSILYDGDAANLFVEWNPTNWNIPNPEMGID